MPLRRNLLAAAALVVAATGALAAQAKPAATAKTVWPDEGPRTWTPRPTAAAITANDLRTRLYQLADDSMQGRRIGDPGNHKATDYIAREFTRMGLKPGGDNGSYFQDLPYGTNGFDASPRLLVAGVPLTDRTEWIPAIPTAANGLGARADVQNLPTVFAGRAGDSSVTLDPAIFRGKVAVFVGAAPNTNFGGGRGAAASCPADQGWPAQRGAADALAAAAAAAAANAANGRGGRGGGGGGGGGRGAGPDRRPGAIGVAGVLTIQEAIAGNAANAAFGQSRGMRPTLASNGMAGATISAAAAAKLFGKPVDQLTVGTVGQPVTMSWNYAFKMSATPGRNVIAILPGSDPARASQYVLVGAHNDHNGVNATPVDHDSLRAFNTIMRPQGANDQVTCVPNARQQFLIDSLIRYARAIRPPRRDSIMNGADDDGSGTVVLLEIAEAFAKEKPARSIIFVSHVGEEAGLLGSAWFTDHPTIPLDSVVAAHNMDMLGKGRVTDVRFGGANSVQTLGARRLAREFGDIIDSVNAISKEPMALDKSWDVTANPLNRFCRSDQVNYVRKNLPITYFSLGYSRDYHQPTDEPQYIDYEHSGKLARFIHDVMTAVANRAERPRIDGPDPAYPNC